MLCDFLNDSVSAGIDSEEQKLPFTEYLLGMSGTLCKHCF